MTQLYVWKRALDDAEVDTLLAPAYGPDVASGTSAACTMHCVRSINTADGNPGINEHIQPDDCMYKPPGSGNGEAHDGPGYIYTWKELCCPLGWAKVTGR